MSRIGQGADDFHASCLPDLEPLRHFIDAACAGAGADAETVFAIRLAVEEVFANIYEHGYATHEGPVDISVRCDAGRISVCMTDQAPPFDPADAPAPDLDSDWERRNPGGLGLHLARQLMDEVKYRRGAPCGNVFTLVKKFAGHPDRPLPKGTRA